MLTFCFFIRRKSPLVGCIYARQAAGFVRIRFTNFQYL